MIDLSIIIVTYKTSDLVVACLKSVFSVDDSLNLEVFVVDNASDDGTVERVRREFPSVKVIANAENVGFPRANNQALAEATADVILLLNPDTIVHDGGLAELIQFFKEHSTGLIAGLNVRNADGSHQDCVHTLPNLRSLFFSVLRLDRMFAGSAFFNAYAYAGSDFVERRTVGSVSGAALALDRKALHDLKGLDPNLFWFEDVDICCRAWESRLPVYFLPNVRVTHLVGQSAKRNIRRVLYHQHVSRVRYFRKHSGPATAGIVTVVTVIELFVKTLTRSIQSLRTAKRSECRLRLAGYLDAVIYLATGRVPSGSDVSQESERIYC